MANATKNQHQEREGPPGITSIRVSGFKSIADEQKIEVRPLTILAGANSSGKSSMMQPLLLLKQTLEADYDPGPLLLDGPILKFTLTDQLLTRIGRRRSSEFRVGMRLAGGAHFLAKFRKERRADTNAFSRTGTLGAVWKQIIQEVIYVRGLRSGPERTQPVTGVGPTFPGTFEKYTASVVRDWIQKWWKGFDSAIHGLQDDLTRLSLTGGVDARPVGDVQIELRVARLPNVPPDDEGDMVNIADVGVGVSQALPVLVALRAARPGTLVYVEQPETHLHPRAQVAMAQILASAANRGVRVVIETHSSLLLLGVETLVSKGILNPGKVKLHWFERREDGRTVVRSGDLDEAGRSGEWPMDFDDVTLEAQKDYLDAASERLFAR